MREGTGFVMYTIEFQRVSQPLCTAKSCELTGEHYWERMNAQCLMAIFINNAR